MPDNVLNRRAAIAAILMAGAAVAGEAMVPTRKMARLRGHFDIEELVPRSFGDWRIDTHAVGGIVNPETAAMLNRIYSQLLDRVYIDSTGDRIMLSIAYGDDQADDSMQLHYPEVCYPAQGFQVKANRREQISTPEGLIHVRRLETQQGEMRYEPVTYWTIVGDQQVIGGWERKKSEILHGIRGEIVDGLLFRVSSIDRNAKEGFEAQDRFIRDVVKAMSPAARRQLVGLA
ncbi:MAG: exosortase-associated protein EpsI, B-type [Burkholderiaceae bacterium]